MKKIAIVALLATILLSASASTAVEDSTFVVGEKWAFGTEIDLMEEVSSEISELEAKELEAEVLLEYKSIKSPVNGMVFDNEKSVEITGSPFRHTLESQLLLSFH